MELITVALLIAFFKLWPGLDLAWHSVTQTMPYAIVISIPLGLVLGSYWGCLIVLECIFIFCIWIDMARITEKPPTPPHIGNHLPQQRPAWIEDLERNRNIQIGEDQP